MSRGNQWHRWLAISSLAAFLFISKSVTPSDAHAQAVQSDDFYSTSLDPVWTFSDPVGDATLLMSGTNLLIRVPGGVSHNLWESCNCAPRLLQTIADANFEVEAKYDSRPSARYQFQGIVVHEDADTYLRFDVSHDGTNARIFAGFINGINPASIKINAALPGGIPAYLKVNRSGTLWEFLYSYDGSAWTSAGTFTRGMVVTEVGPFVGNTLSDEYNTPPFVADLDYFFNTASPIVPEDNGDPSAPTYPVVDVWYGDTQNFGQLGNPQRSINVLGTVWDTDDIATLSYTLNGGASTALPQGPDGFRLIQTGDYNIEIDHADLTSGANSVVITAIDTLGEQTDHPVTINYTDGVTWALPYDATFTTATAIPDVAQVIDGRWNLSGQGVTTDSSATGYDRYLVLGDMTWTPDYEVTVPMTIHEGDLGGVLGVGVIVGWQGHEGPTSPALQKPYQMLARIENFPTSPTLIMKDNDDTRAQMPVTVLPNVPYNLKVRSQSIGGGLAKVDVKFWEDGTLEPGTWDLTYDFDRHDGSIVLVADYANVTFGDVSVVQVPTVVHEISTSVVGNGSITLDPDFTLHADSTYVVLTADPDPGHAFLGWSDGLTGRMNPDTIMMLADTSVTATFVPGIASDDFYGPTLDTSIWEFVDPLGDATLTMSGTNATVNIPGGIKHNLSAAGNLAPRLMQVAPDTDFEVEVKFDSRGIATYQGQGIIVEEDLDTYIRFEIIYTSTGPQIFAGYFDAGVLTTIRLISVADAPGFLRVVRTGDNFELRSSFDDEVWTRFTDFDQLMVVTKIGVFFSNTGGGANYWETPMFTGNVDYFFNALEPIVPEDGGNPSAETPPVVEVWYGDTQNFGQLGVPQRWANILGHVWDTDAIASLSYTLNGGPSYALNMGPDGQRLVSYGDYNVEIDYEELIVGANALVITAIDTLGEQTEKMVTINYTAGITWEMPYVADWSAATEIADVANVGDGRWILTPDGLRTDPAGTGYDRFVVMGDRTWMTDYEVTVPMTIHAGNLGGNTGFGIAIGWRGHVGGGIDGPVLVQPRLENRYQAIGWLRNFPDDPVFELKDDEVSRGEVFLSVSADVKYILKMRSETIGEGLSRVGVKFWQEGTTEPTEWLLADDFAPYDGSVVLIGHMSDVTFGNVDIAPLASFPLHVLTTNVTGNGAVTRIPDYAAYSDSALVELTAEPDPGWAFTGWTGGITSTTNPVTIAMQSDSTITANFIIPEYSITRNVLGSGSIELSPDQFTYGLGDTVVVTAVPDSGYVFMAWSEGLSGTQNPDTLIMISDITITANFAQALYQITTTVNGNGSITVDPDMEFYADGDTISFEAIPDPGWKFGEWSDGLTGKTNPAKIVIQSDTTVTATFTQDAFTVTLLAVGNGTVEMTPIETSYLYGDTIVISAEPDSGYYFYGWSDDFESDATPDTVIVTGDMNILGTFFATIVGIETTPSIRALTVRQNSPNPFKHNTYLDVGLPSASDVEINIYDVAGRRVYTERVSGATPGWNRFPFAGRDLNGQVLPSGVYFYQIRAKNAAVTKKMVIVR